MTAKADTNWRETMKQQNILLCIIFSGIVHSAVCVSANAEPRKDCELALDSLGYNLNSHAFEEAGWLSKEKHIFNGTLICHINKKKEIHSIEDDTIVIVKDGLNRTGFVGGSNS